MALNWSNGVKVLVTGGAGFIGSNFIRHLLRARPDAFVLNFDKLTYAGNLENLADVFANERYRFIQGDITDFQALQKAFAGSLDAVVHFAAESHVDRSIENASPFLQTNVLGTHCLLEATRKFNMPRFVQISTDEVYGSAPSNVNFTEEASLRPRSPYAASKAAADHLVAAYANTHGISAVILRCTNNYGPFQFPEKLIPLAIANALKEKPIPIYGDGLQERDWLFVEDFCRAVVLALEKANPGSIYNISTGRQQTNLKVIQMILANLGKSESLLQHVMDRPGHDRRYALDSSNIERELGWKAQVPFEEGLRRMVDWYTQNKVWLDHARSGEYQNYYQRQYASRSENSKE